MKIIKTISKSISAFVLLFMVQVMAFAQETKKVDVDITTDKGGNWYAQPWVWIVGGAVFLLLLVALMRNNSNKD